MKKLVGFLVLAAAASAGNAAEQDAAYWTSSYAGPSAGALRCVAPAVPAVSEVSQRIRHVARSIKQWQNCHRGVLASLDPAQAAQHIPHDSLVRMSPDEREAAIRHVREVHTKLADAIQLEAVPVIAQHDAWFGNTLAYVAKQNGPSAGDLAAYRNAQIARQERAGEMRQRKQAAGQIVY
ncbi:hypothetical protein [uncultured Massilia sp.]|uniref:hypothetical protein n=1 Tax=uncultured Massilia sp. TaxID=169973 RepID=UPI002589C5DB|nr:hypothetical protein [uncultured Massilia sp.]